MSNTLCTFVRANFQYDSISGYSWSRNSSERNISGSLFGIPHWTFFAEREHNGISMMNARDTVGNQSMPLQISINLIYKSCSRECARNRWKFVSRADLSKLVRAWKAACDHIRAKRGTRQRSVSRAWIPETAPAFQLLLAFDPRD